MKQKLTIYHVGEDGRSGTQSYVFTSQDQVQQFKRDTIENILAGIDTDDDTRKEIEAHLAAGGIGEAWDIYQEQVKDPLDTYNFDESEIEVEVTIPRETIKELAMKLVYGGKFSFDVPLPRADAVADFIEQFLNSKP